MRIVATLVLLIMLPAGAAMGDVLEKIEAYENRIADHQAQLDEMRAELQALKLEISGDLPEPESSPEFVGDDVDEAPQPLVLRRTDNGEFTIGGRFHRVMLQVDDGGHSRGFFAGSDQGPTMINARATRRINDGTVMGGTIELGVQSNRTFRLSQDSPNPGGDILVRIAEMTLEHDNYGKVSFGSRICRRLDRRRG